jgi:excinuclease ABC subunit C
VEMKNLKKLNPKGKRASYGAGLPDSPGVYYFKNGKNILYVGKATSLRDRVKSYFGKDLIVTRGPLLLDMVTKATTIKFQKTDSVLEALILEANEIKKYQPYYNTKEKDDKSFNYVVITNEAVPKVIVERGKNLKTKDYRLGTVFGPYTSGSALREALRIIRRIFPYVDASSSKKQNSEFYRQLGLMPDIEIASSRSGLKSNSKGQTFSRQSDVYKNNIKNIKLFFEGKKNKILQALKKEMLVHAKKREFERANEIKKQVFALEHINDVALIKTDLPVARSQSLVARIEAYDISHTSGKEMVGVMTVVLGGEKEPSEYRKFIVRGFDKSNDVGALREVVRRRFAHSEWQFPDLIVADGNEVQKKVIEQVLKEKNIDIPVVALVKDARHRPKAIIGNTALIKSHKKDITLSNAEAHRFSLSFHRKKRAKKMFG